MKLCKIKAKLEPLTHWLCFGVLFALLPFGLDIIIFFGNAHHPKFYWYYLWEHGELLLIATAFAADALGDLYRHRRGNADSTYTTLTVVGLALSLVVESFCFALVRSRTLNYDPLVINIASWALFLVTFICACYAKALAAEAREASELQGATI